MLETSVRVLRLLSLLQDRRVWSGAELAERLDVTTRTVRNDVERLRTLGYRVDSSTGTTGGYRLAAGTSTPPLLLDDDEAVAVTVGLGIAAAGVVSGIEEPSARALAKVEQTLPPRLRQRVTALREGTVTALRTGPTVRPHTLTGLTDAIRDHEQVQFQYVDHDGRRTVRRVEPHRLVYTGRRWYLLGWDVGRDDWRNFRADRIEAALRAGTRFDPRQPPAGDAAEHVLGGTGSRAWPYPARVRLHGSLDAITERMTATSGVLHSQGEDIHILETGGSSLYGLAAFLVSLDVEFEVLEPVELRPTLQALAERLNRAARG